MPTTANGAVSLCYETFGADDDPALLLVNGLGRDRMVELSTSHARVSAAHPR